MYNPSGIISTIIVTDTHKSDYRPRSKKQIYVPASDAAIIRIQDRILERSMIYGYLMAEGIHVPRSRVRASIHCVDPVGVEERRHRVRRRVYCLAH